MKVIPLTQDQVALVDDEDFEWLSESKWHAIWAPKTESFYAAHNIPTGLKRPRQRRLQMHDAIWEHHYDPIPEGFTVDHADRASLNDRRSNLRLATYSQQSRNRRNLSSNTSGYRGVYRHKPSGGWRAQIKVDLKQIYLGTYDDPGDAARAYDAAAIQRDPEFAQLNFP